MKPDMELRIEIHNVHVNPGGCVEIAQEPQAREEL